MVHAITPRTQPSQAQRSSTCWGGRKPCQEGDYWHLETCPRVHEICGVKNNKLFGDVAGPDEEDLEVSKRSAEALFIYGCRRDLRHWRSLLQNTISSPALLELRAACDMCRQKQCSGWALFNQGAVIKLTQFASVYQGAARRTWIWRSTPRWRGGMRPRRPRAIHERSLLPAGHEFIRWPNPCPSRSGLQ